MDLIEVFKVIIIGIVEGISEWLPISSTGHMLLVDELMPLNMSEAYKEMFFVVIQLGAIIAVIFAFFQRVFPFDMKNNMKLKPDVIKMWKLVFVAMIPTGILGFLLDDFLEKYFGNAFTIALMLIIYGIAFIVVENWNKKRTFKVNEVNEIGYLKAIYFGLFQALAMIPGTSRSGATIIGGLLMGVSRTAAAEFTFFLAIPTMLGASLFKLVKHGFAFTSNELMLLLLGMFVAFIVSYFVIKFLMSYIQKHDFKIFGWYRIVLGIIVLLIMYM